MTHERHAIQRIGDALRRQRARTSKFRRRGAAVALLAGALGLTIALPPRPLLVWNASASAPVGLYVVTSPSDVATGDMVIARLPEAWRLQADARRYVPATVPLVKKVAATPGDTVCASGKDIRINGRWRAERRTRDGRGRIMPWWQGCVTLQGGTVFLLTANPSSFDGRYFGPTSRADIVGKAHLLWPAHAEDSRYD